MFIVMVIVGMLIFLCSCLCLFVRFTFNVIVMCSVMCFYFYVDFR